MNDLQLKNRAAETLLFIQKLDRTELPRDLSSGTKIPNWLKAMLQECEIVNETTWTIDPYQYQFVIAALSALGSSHNQDEATRKLGLVSSRDILLWLADDTTRLKTADTIAALYKNKLSITQVIKKTYVTAATEILDLIVMHLNEAMDRRLE